MSAILTLWTNYEAAGGVPKKAVRYYESGSALFTVDQRHLLRVAVPTDHDWLDALVVKDVLRCELDNGLVSEWQYAGDVRALGAASVEVAFDPPLALLRDVGLIHQVSAGGITYHTLGNVDATIANYIDDFVIPTLDDAGLTWIDRGTIDDTQLYSWNFDRFTCLRFCEFVKSETLLEYQLRRNGAAGYYLDFLDAIGPNETLRVAEALNLVSLTRRKNREALYTVMLPKGPVPAAGIEHAGIEFAAWKVAGAAGDVLTLADRAGGPGPIQENAQFVTNASLGISTHYVLKKDGSLTAITNTVASTQAVTVASASGIAVDDDVEIRLASGKLVTELHSPSGITSHGRIVGTYDTEYRGERNHTPNPFADDWPTKPTGSYGEANGSTGGGTTLALKNVVPSDQAFAIGDLVYQMEPFALARVTANATASGGLVTLTVASSIATTDGEGVYCFHVASRLPTGWSDPNAGTDNAAVFHYRPTTEPTTITGLVNGAQTSVFGVVSDGFTANAWVRAGDKYSDGTNTKMVMISTQANGSGQITIYLSGRVTVTDNAAVTITRPSFEGDTFGSAIALQSRGTAVPTLDTPSYTVRYTPGYQTVWASLGMTLRADAAHNLAKATTMLPPILELRDASSLLESAQQQSIVLAAWESVDVILRASFTLAVDTSLKIRVKGPQGGGSGSDPICIGYVPWTTITLGSDPATPPIRGSHATRMWQDGQVRLTQAKSMPTSYDMRLWELAERWGLPVAEKVAQLGTTVRALSPTMGEDTSLRAVEVEYDLVDKENTRVVLATRQQRLARRLARSITEARGGAGLAASTATYILPDGTAAPLTRGPILLGAATKTKQIVFGPEAITFAIDGDTRRVLIWAGQTPDVNAKFLLDNHGFLEWGAGGDADQDSSLYRDQLGRMVMINPLAFIIGLPGGADTFRVSTEAAEKTKVWVNNPGGVGTVDVKQFDATEPVHRVECAAAADDAWASFVTGDSFTRHIVEADGKHWWGPGSGAVDANLYRSAADRLKTDDELEVALLLLTAASVAGGARFRLPHGTAPTSPVDGDCWTTTAGLYVRINGATVGPLS